MKSFIEKSMSILIEASKNIQLEHSVRKALSVVQTLAEFLDRYEGKKPIKPEMKSNFMMQYQSF